MDIVEQPKKWNPNPEGKGGWKKGQSGNPSGKPSKALEFQKLIQEYAPKALETLIDVLENGKNSERLVAAQEVLNRAYGKPIQANVTTQTKSFEAMLDVLAGKVTIEELDDVDLNGVIHNARAQNGAPSLH